MKTEKNKLPPISLIVDYYSGNPGSLDFVEMNNQLPNKLTQSLAYEEIATLSELTNTLMLENAQLLRTLYAISADETNQAIILEHRLISFLDRLKDREKELKDVSKLIHQFDKRSKTKSNFIEVEVARDRRQSSFDLVATSLLASNEQRKFFKAPDIERQNKELGDMIRFQEEELRIIRARYSLYAKMQQNNSLSMKLGLLNKGQRPLRLVDVAPDSQIEHDITISILKNELRNLIGKRKMLSNQQLARKYKIRVYRLRFRSAYIIQKLTRGFLVRRKMKLMMMAAILIQKVFRGYLSRHSHNFLSKQNSLSKVNKIDENNNNKNFEIKKIDNNKNTKIKDLVVEDNKSVKENAEKMTRHRNGIPSLPIPRRS